jgi:Family of unknown function (DUF6132)
MAEGAQVNATLRRLGISHWRTALGAAIGAGAGAAYAHYVGCATGTCPLTSNVWTAALFFGFSGGLVGWPAKTPAKPVRAAAPDGAAPDDAAP